MRALSGLGRHKNVEWRIQKTSPRSNGAHVLRPPYHGKAYGVAVGQNKDSLTTAAFKRKESSDILHKF